MQTISHETIYDDEQTQLFFNSIDSMNELVPPHWHNHLEVLYICSGTMLAFINEKTYELHAGDILVVNPLDIHYTQMQGNVHYYLLQISASHLARIRKDLSLVHFIEYLPANTSGEIKTLNQELKTIFMELARLDQNREAGYQLLFLIQIYQMLYLIYTKASELLTHEDRKQNARDFERIKQSMQYVRENYMHPITLSDLATLLSLSPEYFCRLFKKYTGQSFLAYVNQIRLQNFHHDLMHSEESITFLLEKNGITSYKTFMKQFKKAYGTTPHRLRSMHN